MIMKVDPKLRGLMNKVDRFIKLRPGMEQALSGTEFSIGPSRNPEFSIPAGVLREAAYVGDSRFVADAKTIIASEEVKQLYAQSPGLVETRFLFDDRMQKYRLQAQKRGRVADWAADAAPDLMGAQALSPWNVGWFAEIFQQPLLYSNYEKFMETEQGTEPWCDVMNMQLADFAGFAVIEDSGRLSNNATQDVNVQSGLMSSPVINMTASYSLSVEELKRAEQSGSPFGQRLISTKQKYSDYVLHMATAALAIFGNVPTETVGLLQVPAAITVYGGNSMRALFLAGGAAVGSNMLSAIQAIVIPFLNTLYNKAETLVIGMSPACYNYLTAPYSQLYNPTAALKAFKENFIAGLKENGDVPNIEFVIEPLLAGTNAADGTNPFNANAFDYLILSSPRMRTGPDNQAQPMVKFGAPLLKFVYPTIPGSYNTQYKFLRRIAGVYSPVRSTTQVISGFGVLTNVS